MVVDLVAAADSCAAVRHVYADIAPPTCSAPRAELALANCARTGSSAYSVGLGLGIGGDVGVGVGVVDGVVYG